MRHLLKFIYFIITKIFSGKKLTGKYPILFKFKLFLISKIKSTTAIVGTHRMYLDSLDSLNLSVSSLYDPLTTSLVKKIVREGDTVIDVGANIGYYTLIFAQLVGRSGRVFAFEPDPVNYSILTKNIETNKYNNVIPTEKALADYNGKTEIHLSIENNGDHRLFYSESDRERKLVEVIKLDDFHFPENFSKEIKLIKMDVQGSEYRVLKGMDDTLKKSSKVKYLICEFSPFLLKPAGAAPQDFIDLILNFGFQLYDIDETTPFIKKQNIEALIKKYDADKPLYTNLLCVHKTIEDEMRLLLKDYLC